jgi:cytochrome c oxidase assembly factor CtaG
VRARATRALAVIAAGLAAAEPALAHGGPHAEGFGWTFNPVIVAMLTGTAMLAGLGTLRLRRRTGRFPRGRALRGLAFGAGWLAVALALLSPLHAWGEHVFTAHMVEHEILMAVAAPLLVVAKPLGTALWGLPVRMRKAAAHFLRSNSTRAGWSFLVHPVSATALHAAVLWSWHAPPIFEASLASVALHLFQHASFLAAGVIFWWSMLHRASPGEALGHVAITMIHMSVLGALIALAPRVIYLRQTSGAALAGLTPLADQQIAGLVMWIPAGTLYAAAALGFAALWIRGSGQTWRPIHEA